MRLFIMFLVLTSVILTGCGGRDSEDDSDSDTGADKTTAKKMEGEETMAENPVVLIETEKGSIKIELFAQNAPRTVENFLGLVRESKYDGVVFHRVIPEFMIQGGDTTGTGGDSLFGGKFEDEINAKSLGLDEIIVKDSPLYATLKSLHGARIVDQHKDDSIMELYEALGYKYDDTLTSHMIVKGSLAMANSGPNTNSSQFFIVTQKPQPHLDGKHTCFGEVVEGMDVVQAIRQGDKMIKVSVIGE